MTTLELQTRINTYFSSYGHFIVSITYRDKEYTCTTTNTMAIDCMYNEGVDYDRYYKTAKQALLALWDECKTKNNLK